MPNKASILTAATFIFPSILVQLVREAKQRKT